MDFVLDLLQGVGLAAAIGVRPLLPVLLAAALAAGNLGLDFEGTDFAFLESVALMGGVLVAAAAAVLVGRSLKSEPRALVYAIAAASVALGALEAAGSLADRDHPVWPGLLLGAAAAVLGFAAARSLFARVRGRLDTESAAALPIYAEGAALAAAGLSILFPPLALAVVAGLAWLLVGGRRRQGEKFAGLRVLR